MSDDDDEPLLDQVAGKWLDYNREWLDDVFERYADVVIIESEEEQSSWTYTFKDAVLKGVVKCGDSGGKTKAGKPCGLRAKAGTNRCAKHPVRTVALKVGPDCGAKRPIAGPAGTVTVTTDDGWATEIESEGRFISATHVWSEIILLVKKDLELEPEAYLVLPDGERVPADPLWPSSMLLRLYGDHVRIDGAAVQPGHTLEDYGVVPNSQLPMSIQ